MNVHGMNMLVMMQQQMVILNVSNIFTKMDVHGMQRLVMLQQQMVILNVWSIFTKMDVRVHIIVLS